MQLPRHFLRQLSCHRMQALPGVPNCCPAPVWQALQASHQPSQMLRLSSPAASYPPSWLLVIRRTQQAPAARQLLLLAGQAQASDTQNGSITLRFQMLSPPMLCANIVCTLMLLPTCQQLCDGQMCLDSGSAGPSMWHGSLVSKRILNICSCPEVVYKA